MTKRSHVPRSTIGIRSPDGFLQIDGCQIAWAAYPSSKPATLGKVVDGQVIVCLHEIGSGSRDFQPLLQNPPAGCRLVLFDWPDHGSSTSLQRSRHPSKSLLDIYADILHAVLEALAITKPVLLACGFGAAVAIQYTSLHPENIFSLALCQPAGLIHSKDGRAGTRSICFLRKLKATPGGRESSLTGHRQTLRIEALEPQMQPLLDAAEASLQQSQPILRSSLAALKVPVFLALSRESRQFPLRTYLELLDPLLALAPQHRITVFGGGYLPAWDEPNRFAQALNGFIQSQLPLSSHHHAWLLAAVDYPAENMNLWKCVHPECSAEQALPVESNPNAS